MTKLLLSLTVLLAGLAAKAGTCPDPIEMFQRVQIEGNETIYENLTESCDNSIALLHSCRQKGMDEYNRRMAINVQQQCESDFMKVENFRSKTFKARILTPYLNMKYACELNNRHSESRAALCRADAAKVASSYFNISEK